MDVFEAIEKRRSIREYEATPVPQEKLERILEAARLAPSASNVQPRHFILVADEERKSALSAGMFAGFLKQAPLVVVACGDEKKSPKWYAIDVAIAVENMVLAATGEGLGTCWIGSFDEAKVRGALKIPENLRVVVLLAIGYPTGKEGFASKVFRLVRKRKSLDEIVGIEDYGKPYRSTSK
jgi:nitroreductase